MSRPARQRRHQLWRALPLGLCLRSDTLTCVCDRTHSYLRALVERPITSVDASQWPAPLRAQGERAADAACQYGLGLIRMLAEYQVLEGMPDVECAQLAARLMAACAAAKCAIAGAGSVPPPPATVQTKWRAGHAQQRPRGADAMPSPARRQVALRSLRPAAASAPPATSASAGTPAARGSGGTREADSR